MRCETLKWLHWEDRSTHHSLVIEQRPLVCLGREPIHRAQGLQGGRRQAALCEGLFGTAGGPAGSLHPTSATHWGGICCPSPEIRLEECQRHRTFTPLTLPCVQGMGQLLWELGKSCSIPGSQPELFPPALDPTPIHTSSSQSSSLCRMLGQRGG